MTTTEHDTQHRVLDFGGFPGRWEITRSTEDTSGESLEMRFEMEEIPEDGPFVHTHPHAEESYEVLSGVLEVYEDGEWIEVSAGEKHAVPPGTPHTFRNTTPVELINVHQPATQHEAFFRRFHRLVTERESTRNRGGFDAPAVLCLGIGIPRSDLHRLSDCHELGRTWMVHTV
jgi:mannose-6-phosphate isomerase-like protein (cupin superfamily)